MFSNSEEDNKDFCESYKSQILTSDEPEESSLFINLMKVLFIFILLVLIAAVSFYGYRNFMDSKTSNDIKLPPQSVQISDDDLMVTLEETQEEPKKEPKKTIEKEKAIDTIADEVKMAIAKSESVEAEQISKEIAKEKHLEVPTDSSEAKYLEDLAKLSDAIDKDRAQ